MLCDVSPVSCAERVPISLGVPRWSCVATIVGGGPAGLMAAQVLADAGVQVQVFDSMASVGRKFLLAGKGGLNLTHSEDFEPFVARYGAGRDVVGAWLQDFDAAALRRWAADLGVETFVGSSGRVFPVSMKAAPLLRAWLHRLRNPAAGVGRVQVHVRHRWLGWTAGKPEALRFCTPAGELHVQSQVTLLALGGASWPQLGSDGAWVAPLRERGVRIVPLQAANCGFDVQGGWSAHLRQHFAGHALKSVVLTVREGDAIVFQRKGEFVLTTGGVEGSIIYAASALLREAINRDGEARMQLDLLPDLSLEQVVSLVSRPRAARSWSNHLKGQLGLHGVKLALLYEGLGKNGLGAPHAVAQAIKALVIRLSAPRPLSEAISTAGGVALDVLEPGLMLRALPGVFCAGEMLDWEAPTGGYLLQASFSSGWRAGHSMLQYLKQRPQTGDEP